MTSDGRGWGAEKTELKGHTRPLTRESWGIQSVILDDCCVMTMVTLTMVIVYRIVESLCHTPKTDTTVRVNLTSMKNKNMGGTWLAQSVEYANSWSWGPAFEPYAGCKEDLKKKKTLKKPQNHIKVLG